MQYTEKERRQQLLAALDLELVCCTTDMKVHQSSGQQEHALWHYGA
jgi:hypothetical protein